MEKDICREQICLSEGKEKGAVLFYTLYHFLLRFHTYKWLKKSHYLLQFTTNSAVLAFQVSVLDGCVGEWVPSWLTNVSVFGIITCTDVQWINVSKLFSLLVQSFWIANLYYASWLTRQCKESCLYMYVMSVKSTGFTGFCGSGFGFSQIC